LVGATEEGEKRKAGGGKKISPLVPENALGVLTRGKKEGVVRGGGASSIGWKREKKKKDLRVLAGGGGKGGGGGNGRKELRKICVFSEGEKRENVYRRSAYCGKGKERSGTGGEREEQDSPQLLVSNLGGKKGEKVAEFSIASS